MSICLLCAGRKFENAIKPKVATLFPYEKKIWKGLLKALMPKGEPHSNKIYFRIEGKLGTGCMRQKNKYWDMQNFGSICLHDGQPDL